MTQAKRVAVVCPRFSETGTVGGAETLLKRLAELLAESGREVHILTTCATDHFTWANALPPGRRRVGNLEVHFFPVDERDTAAFHKIQQAISHRDDVSETDERTWIRHSVNSSALYDHLRKHGDEYDRILAGPYLFGVTYAAALIHPGKTWLVPCLHDEPFAYLGIMRELFSRVAGCLFNSEPERELARTLFPRPDGGGPVIAMDIAPFEADSSAFARRHGLSVPYVIYSGRREAGKGTPLLTDYLWAFRQRTGQDVRLILTGSGPVDMPPELAPFVLDLGFVSEEEKHEAMAGAAVFIHPSVNESLGIVLLEAWMAGTPALVHAQSRVLRWQCARSGGGLWFRHYPDFEQELLLLLAQPGLGREMGRKGRDYVRREYARETIRTRLLAAIEGNK